MDTNLSNLIIFISFELCVLLVLSFYEAVCNLTQSPLDSFFFLQSFLTVSHESLLSCKWVKIILSHNYFQDEKWTFTQVYMQQVWSLFLKRNQNKSDRIPFSEPYMCKGCDNAVLSAHYGFSTGYVCKMHSTWAITPNGGMLNELIALLLLVREIQQPLDTHREVRISYTNTPVGYAHIDSCEEIFSDRLRCKSEHSVGIFVGLVVWI